MLKSFIIKSLILFVCLLLFFQFNNGIIEKINPHSESNHSHSNDSEEFLLGIDVLKLQNYKILEGKRVALLTNHTGCDRMGNSTIDLFNQAPNVNLVKLFSPEHGIEGILEGNIDNSAGDRTQLPVISLYGQNRRPPLHTLEDVDIVVFHIQDVGARYFTYITTMVYMMQAVKKTDKEFLVLDRPNPVGGLIVDGAVPPDSLTNQMTAIYPIPTRHGMTVGELAIMFNQEFEIGCRLTVTKMRHWHRNMYFRNTPVSWINLSPNMKTKEGAIFYTGFGWLEATNLSMGRGTDIPFEILGAPWINGNELAGEMNRHHLKGIRFIPWTFTPSQKDFRYYKQKCQGIRAVITDLSEFDCFLTGLYLTKTISNLYPENYQFLTHFRILFGSAEAESWLKNNVSPEAIKARLQPALEQFLQIRKQYLLYQ